MSPVARKVGIGCAVVIAAVGSCVGWYRHEMHPHSIGTIPPASALVVTTGVWLPRSVSKITDPTAIAHIIENMNAQVGNGWQPVVGEYPLPSVSVRVETIGSGVYQWDIGDRWYGADGLYKDVPVKDRDALAAMIRNAPHEGVQDRVPSDAGSPQPLDATSALDGSVPEAPDARDAGRVDGPVGVERSRGACRNPPFSARPPWLQLGCNAYKSELNGTSMPECVAPRELNVPTLAIAHLAEDGREHQLTDHLRRVGELASEFAAAWGAAEHGRMAGELHDLGKYAADFQAYIRDAHRSRAERQAAHIESDPNDPIAKRVDHSTAGAIHASTAGGLMGKLLAFVIAGHHTGLSNRVDLEARLSKPEKKQRLADALKGVPPPELLAPANLPSPFVTKPASAAEGERIARRLELWTRMLFSALCDADFLDTEEFFDRAQTAHRERARAASLDELLSRLTTYVDAKERDAPPTEVNAVRREIRRASIAAAALAPGVFTLTVPTGGGKTLAAMEFALHHARSHGLRRVIVAIPYTSILEQNADVYREAFADDDAVLEHHSNFDPRRETPRSRLAAQNWDAPVVVTTTVQLFESLFARQTSRCRKLHNLAHSVIVLDEAQTMPVHLLAATLEVLGDVARDYGASVVVSTATQPALARASLPRFGLEGMREIVPTDVRAFERLRRVSVRWPEPLVPTGYASLADEIATERDVLAITHKRSDARELTELLDSRLGDASTVHLSALMCAEHRSAKLAEIKRRKKAGEPIRVVSTQLVEAGVDLDFPIVYRALAGLDSMAQAAGRCNREGRLASGELRVFMAESRPPPGVLQAGLAITEGMLRAEPRLAFLEGKHYRRYFEGLYATADTDKKAIQAARAGLRFEDVASAYRMIEDEWSSPIIVRYGRASALLDDLLRYGPSRARHRALGRFAVNAPKRLVEEWVASGHATLDEESGVVALSPHVEAYDARFGLMPDRVVKAASVPALIIDG